MGTQVKSPTWSSTRIAGKIVLAVGLTTSLVVAAAASLGTSSADLFVWSGPVSVPIPGTIAIDSFDTCSGGLDGEVDASGNVWSDHGGQWLCFGPGLAAARIPTSLGHATVDVGQSDDLTVSVFVSKVSDKTNRSGPGISLFSDGNYHIYVIYERDLGQITLGKLDSTGNTVLMVIPVADRPVIEISAEIHQPDISVSVDAVLVGTYTMTAAEVATFGANTRFGMEADNDNQSWFESFQVETTS